MLDKIIKIAGLAMIVAATVVLVKAAILADVITAHVKG